MVCKERFSTFERAELRLPRLIKSDGRREPFSEEKLRGGIFRALEKRPIDTDAVEAMIHRIIHQALANGERELPCKQVGEWVMEELAELDQVAYVRFASVYRSFETVDAFSAEVRRLQAEPPRAVKKSQLSLLPGDARPNRRKGDK
jgi:transcriptional repressor NrdR